MQTIESCRYVLLSSGMMMAVVNSWWENRRGSYLEVLCLCKLKGPEGVLLKVRNYDY